MHTETSCPIATLEIDAIIPIDHFFAARLAACRALGTSDLIALPVPLCHVSGYAERGTGEGAVAYLERLSQEHAGVALQVSWRPADWKDDPCPLTLDELIDAVGHEPIARRIVCSRTLGISDGVAVSRVRGIAGARPDDPLYPERHDGEDPRAYWTRLRVHLTTRDPAASADESLDGWPPAGASRAQVVGWLDANLPISLDGGDRADPSP